jgi:hypothetical protein
MRQIPALVAGEVCSGATGDVERQGGNNSSSSAIGTEIPQFLQATSHVAV